MAGDAEYQKKRRDRHQAGGFCSRCKQPSLPGLKLCEYHRQYAAAANAKASDDRRRSYRRTGYLRLRNEMFDHYGRSCACCGETRPEFLTIDHVDGGGAAHRREGVKGGSQTMRWLRRNKFPAGFRILCANCNLAMGIYGVCPHGTLAPQTTGHPANPYRPSCTAT